MSSMVDAKADIMNAGKHPSRDAQPLRLLSGFTFIWQEWYNDKVDTEQLPHPTMEEDEELKAHIFNETHHKLTRFEIRNAAGF